MLGRLLPNLLPMGKSPLILAALATDAVSGLRVRNAVAISSDSSGNFDSALLTDVDGENYIVRIPTTASAGTELELELQVLKNLNAYKNRLGFDVPQAIGETREVPSGNRVLVFKYVSGSPIDPRRLTAASPIASSVAKTIAAIHSLPIELVQNNGLAEFSPAENIRLRVAELDRAMQSGQVPAILLQRWEDALADVSLFKYQPVVVHASLSFDTVLERSGEVVGVLDWKKVQLGDPALDFGWLSHEDAETVESILLNYQLGRSGADAHILKRATLYAELEWVRWLLHGYAIKDTAIVQEAIEGLQDLAEAAQEGTLPSLSSAPPALQIVETISFIEQDDSVEVEPTIETESDVQLDDTQKVDDKTKPIDIVDDKELF
jgi:aminoglycoside phosphotransferase (APT) family kinase protein